MTFPSFTDFLLENYYEILRFVMYAWHCLLTPHTHAHARDHNPSSAHKLHLHDIRLYKIFISLSLPFSHSHLLYALRSKESLLVIFGVRLSSIHFMAFQSVGPSTTTTRQQKWLYLCDREHTRKSIRLTACLSFKVFFSMWAVCFHTLLVWTCTHIWQFSIIRFH